MPEAGLAGSPASSSTYNEQPASPKVPDIDISKQDDKRGVSEVTGQDLLKFARHILIWLLVLTFAVMLMYYFSDRGGANEVAAKEIFEVIKIGVLPW